MIPDATIFSSKSPASHTSSINTADGSQLHVKQVGQISTSTVSLPNTFHVPKLTINLVSVGQLCELGLTVIFSSSGCQVQDLETGQTIGIGRKVGRMFELIHLHTPSKISSRPTAAASTTSISPFSLWHSRLGHVSVDRLRSLVSSGQLGSVKIDDVTCLPCKLGKQSALPFSKSDSS
ncbi:hypothetical protein ACHQM5_017839 [Ranunculus cassubicifolius]